MGYEPRGGKLHYYYKVRDGEHVRSVHVGEDAAPYFERLAQHDSKLQGKKQELRTPLEEQSTLIKTLIRFRQHLTEAMLYRRGWHNHRGHWRKRREERRIRPSAGSTAVHLAPARQIEFLAQMEGLGRLMKFVKEGSASQADIDRLFRLDLRSFMDGWIELARVTVLGTLGHLQALAPHLGRGKGDFTRTRSKEVLYALSATQDEVLQDKTRTLWDRVALIEAALCLLNLTTLRYVQEAKADIFTKRQWQRLIGPAANRLKRAQTYARDLEERAKRHLLDLQEAATELEENEQENGRVQIEWAMSCG